METIIVSIICIALIVFGGMTMSKGFMTSVDASTTGLSEIGHRDDTLMRTELKPISTNISTGYTPDPLDIILENTGQTKLADFEKWDVIVQYYDNTDTYQVKWLPYAEDAGANEWEVAWIRLNGQPETFEPNVLNSGEQILITAWLDPPVKAGSTNMVVISTPSGVTTSTYFSP
jgi:hypothetical protein